MCAFESSVFLYFLVLSLHVVVVTVLTSLVVEDRLVLEVHGVGFLSHPLHPTVDELLVLGRDACVLLLGQVKLHSQSNNVVLESLCTS